MKITDYVYKGNTAEFSHFRAGYLYYTVSPKEGPLRLFPVPVEDLAGATVTRVEKAMTMMRYIRKAIEDGTLILATENV